MIKKEKIPVHRMDDWKAGVYIKSFAAVPTEGLGYDLSQAHRHDFYYCVLLEAGEMRTEVDFQHFRLAPASLLFTYPGQVHRITAADLKRGWFLAFDPGIIVESLRDILDQCLAEVMVLPLEVDQTASLYRSLDSLHAAYTDPALRFRQPVLQALVTAFVYQIASLYLSAERLRLTFYSARNIEITKSFHKILRRQYRTLKKPADFAEQLNLSGSHLNDTVRLVTGFPVTYFIQQAAMLEAKRLLAYADLSVKEIAHEVGFDDAQYFSRLFRKLVGSAPKDFRLNAKNSQPPAS